MQQIGNLDNLNTLNRRSRRLRQSFAIRDMVSETQLKVADLIAPLFVTDTLAAGENKRSILSMPGQYRYSQKALIEKAKELFDLGIPCISIFPALDDSLKDTTASISNHADGMYQQTIYQLKKQIPGLLVMSDVALDPYSSDGHDGLVDKKTGKILNDESLPILSAMAVSQAQAGADIVGPSDMMDGRVAAIRSALDAADKKDTIILSYTAKYASAFYGPFREALDSAPKSGDKKTYQMDYRNRSEALVEMQQDEAEGADILMVKPGLAYLDIIRDLKNNSNLPIAAYNVSGEYAMVQAAAQNGWIDKDQVMTEMLTSFKRAGSDMILSYFAESMAKLL